MHVVRLGWVVALIAVSSTVAPAASTAGASIASPASRPSPASIAPCGYNDTIDAIRGSYGSASAIGWAGNAAGVVTCLGGSFYVQGSLNKAYGFGIFAGGPVEWVDAEGYLPAQITSFQRDGAAIAITEFADRVVIDGKPFVVVYARVAIANRTARFLHGDPKPSPGLVPLNASTGAVRPHRTVVHDYAVVVDRFGNAYPWPSTRSLIDAGGLTRHYAHMRAFWNEQLEQIAAVHVPDRGLDDAYRAGFVYTEIARSGTHLDTGVNGYHSEFSHDVIGILVNLFTQGYDTDAHGLLLEAGNVVGAQGQYRDGVWTYAWPWAVYLLKTGDLDFVRAHFSASGVAGQPSIEQTAHQIVADRTGPNGIIGRTDDIDSDGYWTVDDYEALTGLAAYRYLAARVGSVTEAQWATREYESLLDSVNRTLASTITRDHLTYLPCSMLEPNSANRCANPVDANWAAPFLFGRWAWDAGLFGMPVTGPGAELIDATYAYGFARLKGVLPPDTFGGYPSDYYSTAYNAGYGSWALAGSRYRDEGIRAYEFMIAHTQSGPYSWWESASAPLSGSPWTGSHPAEGQGSSPHAWGIANADKVLLDSLVAQASDGSLIVGRGIPDGWLEEGKTVSVGNFPTVDGKRIALGISTSDGDVRIDVRGALPAAGIRVELPVFVGNIRSVSAGSVDERTGTVTLPAQVGTVSVRLLHSARVAAA
ncbi:MAG: carbohydrate-binding protein [Actinobacteria bacterium]|nr:carbohydrate-binding protein [Actinomycetota bacterium]